MSSDAMTYALEHGSETEFKNYKTIILEEWERVTENCKAKNKIYDEDDEIAYTLCKCTDGECEFESCFARFCNKVKC